MQRTRARVPCVVSHRLTYSTSPRSATTLVSARGGTAWNSPLAHSLWHFLVWLTPSAKMLVTRGIGSCCVAFVDPLGTSSLTPLKATSSFIASSLPNRGLSASLTLACVLSACSVVCSTYRVCTTALSAPSLMPGAGGACIGCGVFLAFGSKLTQIATMKRSLPVCRQPTAVLISHSLSASSDSMLASIAVAA